MNIMMDNLAMNYFRQSKGKRVMKRIHVGRKRTVAFVTQLNHTVFLIGPVRVCGSVRHSHPR